MVVETIVIGLAATAVTVFSVLFTYLMVICPLLYLLYDSEVEKRFDSATGNKRDTVVDDKSFKKSRDIGVRATKLWLIPISLFVFFGALYVIGFIVRSVF